MITKFTQYNESIKSLLVGPTDEELLKQFSNLRPVDLLWKSVEIGWLNGIKFAFEKDDTLIKQMSMILVESAINGYLDIVKYTIENGADIHHWRDGALFNAAEFGHYDVVKYLLENGADVHSTHVYTEEEGSERYNSYERSVMNNFDDVAKLIKSYMTKSTNESVKSLLVGPTEDEIINSFKDNPKRLLEYSINNNLKKGIEYALKYEDEIIQSFKDDYQNLLEYSIDNNLERGVVYAINHGVNVNQPHSIFLFKSAKRGNINIVKHLLKSNINFDSDALLIAKKFGNYDIVELLTDYKNKPTNESIKDLLVGPTDYEFLSAITKTHSGYDYIDVCVENDSIMGIEEFFMNCDDYEDDETYHQIEHLIEMTIDYDSVKIMKTILKFGLPKSIFEEMVKLQDQGIMDFDEESESYKLIKKYISKSTNESVQTELVVDVIESNDDFINKLVDRLSFVYKKRKDRHTRPIKITGRMIPNIELNILLSNKDNLKIEYLNKEDLKIHINNKLIYYDDVTEDKMFNKIFDVYTKYLNKQKFKIQSGHPF